MRHVARDFVAKYLKTNRARKTFRGSSEVERLAVKTQLPEGILAEKRGEFGETLAREKSRLEKSKSGQSRAKPARKRRKV